MAKLDRIPDLHKPLVSEELFNLAQLRIKHRNNKYLNQQINGVLILRGILYCPVCSKKLSGSGSKGRSKKYFYYHCSYPCHYRIRADYVNEQVLNRISTLKPNKKYIGLFERLIENIYNYLHKERSIDKANINKALYKLMERVANTRELLVKGIIYEEDYLSIKSDCEQRIDSLGEQLNDSYRFDLQKKRDLKKLAAYFSDPALLFKEATTLLQIKAATLFLKEKSIYSENKSTDMLKYEMKTICGHQYLN